MAINVARAVQRSKSAHAMLAPQAQASRAAEGLWSVEARRHVFCAKGACDCREFRARWSLCKHGQLHGRRAGSSWRTSRLRLIDRQRSDRGGGELTMLLLQEESALVARDFWRSAPPLVAVPSELLAFELEAGSPSPPPQTERAGDEGRQETRRPSKTEHASPPISRIRWLRPSPPLGLLLLGVGCLTPHASRLPHRELQTYGGDHGPH